MPINANNFVWLHEPEPGAKPASNVTSKPLAGDYILLTKDGMLKLKRSQYIEDMLGDESTNYINKKS